MNTTVLCRYRPHGCTCNFQDRLGLFAEKREAETRTRKIADCAIGCTLQLKILGKRNEKSEMGLLYYCICRHQKCYWKWCSTLYRMYRSTILTWDESFLQDYTSRLLLVGIDFPSIDSRFPGCCVALNRTNITNQVHRVFQNYISYKTFSYSYVYSLLYE